MYEFIARNKTVDDAVKMFRDALDNGVKLEMLFITDTGTSDGKLLGLITAWDMVGA